VGSVARTGASAVHAGASVEHAGTSAARAASVIDFLVAGAWYSCHRSRLR
jgi:hypothetical protein